MAYDYSKLLGRIVEKYGTQIRFSKAMGLSERSMSLKLNGKVSFRQPEITKACQLLEIDDIDIPSYFFALKVQFNRTPEKEITESGRMKLAWRERRVGKAMYENAAHISGRLGREVKKIINRAEKIEGYEIIQVSRIEREFLDCLPVGISTLCKPIQDALQKGEKMRVVIDYDPHEQKAEFRYYCPN